MTELLKVWCINGRDDEGVWESELYSTYEKAREAFEEYIEDINRRYGEYDEYKGEYESICDVDGDQADYSRYSHYGSFWIEEIEVR